MDDCFYLLYNFSLKHFSFSEEFGEILSKMYVGIDVKSMLIN
jgi:hypothetical protein